jgi:hypothetical protein
VARVSHCAAGMEVMAAWRFFTYKAKHLEWIFDDGKVIESMSHRSSHSCFYNQKDGIGRWNCPELWPVSEPELSQR